MPTADAPSASALTTSAPDRIPEDDVAAGGWAGVVPIITGYGTPVPAPDCDPAIPVPQSVRTMLGSDGG